MNHYTLWHALIGGMLIGLASLITTVLSGKVPGISGVFGRLLVAATPDKTWRLDATSGQTLLSAIACRRVKAWKIESSRLRRAGWPATASTSREKNGVEIFAPNFYAGANG
jgi:hypothetical protein